jgi:hypothetical protein
VQATPRSIAAILALALGLWLLLAGPVLLIAGTEWEWLRAHYGISFVLSGTGAALCVLFATLRRRRFATVLAVLAAAFAALFIAAGLAAIRALPADASYPRTGPAPDAVLLDAAGRAVALSDLYKKRSATAIVFYRGTW